MFGGSKGGTGGNVIFWDFDSSAKLLSKLQEYSTFQQPISCCLYNCFIDKSFVLSISCHDGVNLFLTELYGDSGGLSPYWPAAYFCPYNLLESTQSQPVGRTANALPASIQDMSIDHGGVHILMAEQFLDGPDVITVLNQVRGKRMPHGMTTGRPGYSSFPGSFFWKKLGTHPNIIIYYL